MKVPIMYKSSDRFNAGTDVIYDDESKLQYAPFIYAGVTAKDNGDGGDDEEGEEGMIVTLDSNDVSNISYNELVSYVSSGKVLYIIDGGDEGASLFYLVNYGSDSSVSDDYPYFAEFLSVYYDNGVAGNNKFISAATADEKLAYHAPGGGGDES